MNSEILLVCRSSGQLWAFLPALPQPLVLQLVFIQDCFFHLLGQTLQATSSQQCPPSGCRPKVLGGMGMAANPASAGHPIHPPRVYSLSSLPFHAPSPLRHSWSHLPPVQPLLSWVTSLHKSFQLLPTPAVGGWVGGWPSAYCHG